MTISGFLCWDIHINTVTNVEFRQFLELTLQPLLLGDNYVLLDNATTHHTPKCHRDLERILRGKYFFSPPYTPEFKPIERGFSLIKRFLRDNENRALQNPIEVIQEAFNKYSNTGEEGFKVRNFWRIYDDKHSDFLN